MSRSEAVVIESTEVGELLRFLFYLDLLNKLLLLQRKPSKYMYARCLNFPCFINYLAAFCMFYWYVSLGFEAFFVTPRQVSLLGKIPHKNLTSMETFQLSGNVPTYFDPIYSKLTRSIFQEKINSKMVLSHEKCRFQKCVTRGGGVRGEKNNSKIGHWIKSLS